MPQSRSIWRGPANPRAKQLKPEQWNAHRKNIEHLHQTRGYALHEIMTKMKNEHNFGPTRRQYIRQFEKWGLRKYRCSHPSSSDECETAPNLHESANVNLPISSSPAPDLDDRFLALVEAGKFMSDLSDHDAPSNYSSEITISGELEAAVALSSLDQAAHVQSERPNNHQVYCATNVPEWTKYIAGQVEGTADFLLECDMFSDAFRLYLHLFRQSRATDYPRHVIEGLFGCYRCVTTGEEMNTVESLVGDTRKYIQESHPLVLGYFHKCWGRAHERVASRFISRDGAGPGGVEVEAFKDRMGKFEGNNILSDDIQLLGTSGNDLYLSLPGKYEKKQGMRRTIRSAFRWSLNSLCDRAVTTLMERMQDDIYPAVQESPSHAFRLGSFVVLILRWQREYARSRSIREWALDAFHYLEMTVAELIGLVCQIIEHKLLAMGFDFSTHNVQDLGNMLKKVELRSEDELEKDFFRLFFQRKETISDSFRPHVEGYLLDVARIYWGVQGQTAFLREAHGVSFRLSIRTRAAIETMDAIPAIGSSYRF
ncbi:hypothetical protein MKZ38_009366 [Zalerion maritima]|uniref:Clr5 domain-containing protein n=1 Tax=Zalerion maritima TaxID=339359 RepID=A0AAD5RV59_9PEZI|nr:hypothetical protein MKZ38_009366 [Zalerion maritima]